MIGKKTLSEIRQQLKAALEAQSDDPIRWLEERMSAPAGQGTAGERGNEVLRSLQRLLDGTETKAKPKPRTRRTASTK